MINVKIHSLSEAENLSDEEKENSSMISIQAPGKEADLDSEDFDGRLLRTYFHDTEGDMTGLSSFDSGHAKKILGFVQNSVPTEDENHTLHVHCLAGQRRSAAVALGLTEILTDGDRKPTDKWQNYSSRVYQMLTEIAVREGKYDPF